jgi:hypothetical protein
MVTAPAMDAAATRVVNRRFMIEESSLDYMFAAPVWRRVR